jgi:hypothetical protein
MTPFEFVFALISIITSLALTQIIGGVVAIIRRKDRAGFFAYARAVGVDRVRRGHWQLGRALERSA